MYLVNTNQSITAVLSGAKNTNDANFAVQYQDIVNKTGIQNTSVVSSPGNNAGSTNGVTAVTLLTHGPATGPASGTGTAAQARQMIGLQIYNADLANITVTLTLVFSPSVSVTLGVFTLATLEQLNYSPEYGFSILNASGTVKVSNTSQAATIGAITDSTGGIATTSPATLIANGERSTLIIPVGLLATLVNTTTYQVTIPYGFTVVSALFHTDVPATTGSKLATLTVSTTAGAVTGGVMALTSANQTPTGAAVAATAISGAAATDIATHNVIVTVSLVTAFVEGSGHIEVTLSNNDLAANWSTMSTIFNALRTSLRNAGIVA